MTSIKELNEQLILLFAKECDLYKDVGKRILDDKSVLSIDALEDYKEQRESILKQINKIQREIVKLEKTKS